jgi:hypothetical protein
MPLAPNQAALVRNAAAILVSVVTYVIASLVSVVLINMVVGRFIDPQFVNLWACLVSGGIGVFAAYWTLKLSKSPYSGKAVFVGLVVLMLAFIGLGVDKLQGQPVVWVEIGAQVVGTLVTAFFQFWRRDPEAALQD